MKKAFLFLFVLAGFSVLAQEKEKIFSAQEIVWFGLDFSEAKFVGQFDQGAGLMPAKGSDMKTKYIPAWNMLVITEPQNFELKKALNKENIYYDIDAVNELNKKIDANTCMDYNVNLIERNQIDEMVKKYSSKKKKEGIGLAFIVETFDKPNQEALVMVTFFDISTKKVLISERLKGKASGIGIRNYWAGAIKAIIKKIESSEYNRWKKS